VGRGPTPTATTVAVLVCEVRKQDARGEIFVTIVTIVTAVAVVTAMAVEGIASFVAVVAGVSQPRPMNGILVAMTVMNCTFASSGRLAM
jgi:hypothetical protein